MDSGFQQKHLPGVIDNRDGSEGESRESMLTARLDDDDDDDDWLYWKEE